MPASFHLEIHIDIAHDVQWVTNKSNFSNKYRQSSKSEDLWGKLSFKLKS